MGDSPLESHPAAALGATHKRSGVSAEIALRLAAALGTNAEMWLSMQVAYDLWKARWWRLPKIKRIAA